MSKGFISLRGVSKNYGNDRGIFDVTLELSGGIVGFLGENGAGKTTTMHIIMGLLYPDAGEVYVMGENIWEGKNYYLTKKYLGFLPNEVFLFPDLTGRENLEYASVLKTNDRQWYLRLTEYIEEFGLRDVLDEPFCTYSTGMKKKLQIITSMLGDPPILLWDEPHNGLDVLSNIKMKSLLKQYVSRGERLVFFSSHIIEMVEDICQEVVIIHRGRMVAHAKLEDCGDLTTYYLEATSEVGAS